jgi:pSer/pThr/pTyr-binding forkhead associated (FHA) protein
MSWVLDIHKDEKLQESVPVVNNIVTLGREGCDVNIVDTKMSRHHCTFYMHSEALTIVDNSSTNGTFVNGRKIERKDLKNNDSIIVGTINITVRKV